MEIEDGAREPTLLQGLASSGEAIAKGFAFLLRSLEIAFGDASSNLDPRHSPLSAIKDVVEAVAQQDFEKAKTVFESAIGASGDSKAVATIFLDRALHVAVDQWSTVVRPKHGQRPDILTLTCLLLSNPDRLELTEWVRFAIVSRLRSLYGIAYNAEVLEAMQKLHRDLKSRFHRQQRRRTRRGASGLEPLVIDLLLMEGYLFRPLGERNREAYYEGFAAHPFGVDPERKLRAFGSEDEWPELHGRIPGLAEIVKLAFAQPLGVAGMDTVLGGLLPTLPSAAGRWGGGLITAVAGPAGSGKTSFCLTLSSRLAEVGSLVHYFSSEETEASLEAKRLSISGEPLREGFWPWVQASESKTSFGVTRNADASLMELAAELSRAVGSAQDETLNNAEGIGLVLPRVLVIDSLTATLREDEHRTRRALAIQLDRLREAGVCVFIVASEGEIERLGLDYLIDNFFTLQLDNKQAALERQSRTIEIKKTRQQDAHRGRHLLHIGSDGSRVLPSLHTIISASGRLPQRDPRVSMRIELWPDPNAAYVREDSHTLIYGVGSSGKAKLAMYLALAQRTPRLGAIEHASTDRSRVLVVSFLYDAKYYEEIAKQLTTRTGRRKDVSHYVETLAFYPGLIAPETIANKILTEVSKAQLEGRPYTVVILDGIHNTLLQFPLLEVEPLLWPTIARSLREAGIDLISTFTFFEVSRRHASIDVGDRTSKGPGGRLAAAQEAFFHLLVGQCDYTFSVERLDKNPNLVNVVAESSVESLSRRAHRIWDPRTLSWTGAK